MARPTRDIVVMGGSAGSIELLLDIVATLPADFPGSVFVTVHSGPSSVLPELFAARCRISGGRAVDGERVRPGRVYVCSADQHLILEDGIVRLTNGPRENGFRPSVDALFRSAARVYGPRVVGVVLSGNLDCGSAGLRLIKVAGGAAVVQDPREALFPDMPRHAIEAAKPEDVLPARLIAARLIELAGGRGLRAPGRRGAAAPAEPRRALSELTCPECHGAMRETPGRGGDFRCHVGHLFSLAGLSAEQTRDLEAALWTAVRALSESEALSLRVAAGAGRGTAQRHLERAQALRRCAASISEFLLAAQPPAVPEPGQKKPAIAPRRRPTAARALPPRRRRRR